MNIQPISSTNFEARKKFRIPIKIQTYKRTNGELVDFKNLSGKWVEEYSNPDAKNLYKKAKAAKDWREKVRFLEEMGDYELVDISTKKK